MQCFLNCSVHEILTQSGVGPAVLPSNKVSGDVDTAGPSTLVDGGTVASQPSGASAVLIVPLEASNDSLCQF